MFYKCLKCGHIFEEGEQANWYEHGGEYWGAPFLVNMVGCPICRGEYQKTTPCEICGSEHLEHELSNGVCDECIDEYKNDIDMCFKIGSTDTEEVELNCFLASLFDKQEIEQILFRELKEGEKYGKIYCEKFIKKYRNLFSERLVEEVKYNENSKG